MEVECTYAAAQMQAEIQMHVERDRDIAEVEGASSFKVQQRVVVTMIEKKHKIRIQTAKKQWHNSIHF